MKSDIDQNTSVDRFKENIHKQIESNQGKNIFLDKPEIFRFKAETISAISNVNELNSDSERLIIDYAVEKAIEEFSRINQYYSFDKKSKRELRTIYSDLFVNIRTGNITIEEISNNHYKKLKEWLKKYNPFAEKIYLNADYNVESVSCSEYSSELQIEILQIEITKLKEPVLDIGCGKQKNLVKYLSEKGIDVYGIDRFPFTDNNLYNSDWLDFEYGVEKWGTIVSNLGFSNHFKHHNLREDGNFIEYGKKYVDLLRSLKIEGRFYYAPDLPFIEQYLDSKQFKIDKNEIGKYDYKSTIITRLK